PSWRPWSFWGHRAKRSPLPGFRRRRRRPQGGESGEPGGRSPPPPPPAFASPIPFRIRPPRATLGQCPRGSRQHRLRLRRDVTRRRHLLTVARLLASFGMLAFLLSKFTSFHLSALLPEF